ncbi:MAG: outer membrane beta-barrel protein [Acidobacteria bacterium]|nr:outer membrane beta-barrel protein [Acidobacteriota bacterium]
MRHLVRIIPSLAIAGIVACGPSVAAAQERASLEGFGGLSLNSVTSESLSPSFGGTLTLNVGPAVQIIGEAGRLDNVLPVLSNAAFNAADLGLRLSAIYGEGGVRLLMAPGSPITPYVEGTAGIAKLSVSSERFGTIGNAVGTIALHFVDRTTPTLGGGGGVLLRGGPVVFDLGYRYKQLFANDILRIGLGFGEQLHTHQARVGFGVRF